MLFHPVIIAGDRPRANVDIFMDGGVANIREMAHFYPGCQGGILDFTKITHVDALSQMHPRA